MNSPAEAPILNAVQKSVNDTEMQKRVADCMAEIKVVLDKHLCDVEPFFIASGHQGSRIGWQIIPRPGRLATPKLVVPRG